MSLTIKHSHEDGTLVEGTKRGDTDIIAMFKSHGFRWFRTIGMWGLAGSRDHMARRYVIDNTAAALRGIGVEVSVEIDDAPRSAEDRYSSRAERIEDRQEALEDKSDRLGDQAASTFKRVNDLADSIPFGQPLLVGHHSYAHARRDQDKIQSGMRKGVDLEDAANSAASRADASRRNEARRESGPATQRRIERIETELRLIARNLEKARIDQLQHPRTPAPEGEVLINPWGNPNVARPAVPTQDPCGRCFYPLRSHPTLKRGHKLLVSEQSAAWAQVESGPMCRDAWLSTDQVPVQAMYCGCCCCHGVVAGTVCREHNPDSSTMVATHTLAESAREWQTQTLSRQKMLRDDLAFWKEHLASLTENAGYQPFTKDDFKPGDVVRLGYGPATVIRVNKKTLDSQAVAFYISVVSGLHKGAGKR